MNLINVTANSCQKQSIVLADGSSFSFTIEYKPMQLGWYVSELIYNNFTIQGIRVVVSPNFLQQYRNQIPFGIACYSVASREPMLIEDFSSKNVNLYVLTQDEVDSITEFING